jgi:hypothetical protein
VWYHMHLITWETEREMKTLSIKLRCVLVSINGCQRRWLFQLEVWTAHYPIYCGETSSHQSEVTIEQQQQQIRLNKESHLSAWLSLNWDIYVLSLDLNLDWSYTISCFWSPTCWEQIWGLLTFHNYAKQFLTMSLCRVHIFW